MSSGHRIELVRAHMRLNGDVYHSVQNGIGTIKIIACYSDTEKLVTFSNISRWLYMRVSIALWRGWLANRKANVGRSPESAYRSALAFVQSNRHREYTGHSTQAMGREWSWTCLNTGVISIGLGLLTIIYFSVHLLNSPLNDSAK